MNVDSVFLKGSTHLNCEDFASARDLEGGYGYLIVADGCSSAYRSDVAARLMTLIVERQLEDILSLERGLATGEFLEHALGIGYRHILKSLVPAEHLFSTLVVAVIAPDMIKVVFLGDGCAFYRVRGKDHGFSVSYDQEAPRYPAYLFDDQLDRAYAARFGGQQRKMTSWYENDDPMIGISSSLDPYPHIVMNREGLESLVVSSDGAGTFGDLDTFDVGRMLLDLRGTKGEFIKRRALALERDMLKRGAEHYDDLGLAAVVF